VKKLRVLFVCTGNIARSQMAEGLLRHRAGDRFEVFSAGTEPKILSPTTVAVMREVGIDVAGHRSKSVKEFEDQDFDYLITLCNVARKTCSIRGRVAHQHRWDITDPADLQRRGVSDLQAFRNARDQVAARLEGFIRSVTT